jgi:hypothetical protein
MSASRLKLLLLLLSFYLLIKPYFFLPLGGVDLKLPYLWALVPAHAEVRVKEEGNAGDLRDAGKTSWQTIFRKITNGVEKSKIWHLYFFCFEEY